MDCWEKLKRVLISNFSKIKLRKSKGGRDSGNKAVGGGRRGSGLLSLKNDVQACEYKDIQVMWNILNRHEMEMKQKQDQEQEHTEVITAAIAKPIKCN